MKKSSKASSDVNAALAKAVDALQKMRADYESPTFASTYFEETFRLEQLGEMLAENASKLKGLAGKAQDLKGSQWPIEVARACLTLLELAMAIYQEGFQAVHGTKGVALRLLTEALETACAAYQDLLKTEEDSAQASKMESELKEIEQLYAGMKEAVEARIGK